MARKTKDVLTRQFIAHEIWRTGKRIDDLRDRKVFTPSEYIQTGTLLAEELAKIEVLEQIWTDRFDDIPSLTLIGQIKNGSAE